MTDPPLYERDPEAWQAHLAEGNRTQPRKRVGADVLFRDETGRILLVDPRYKPDWDLPGGMAEANEPPIEAAIREVREELDIEYKRPVSRRKSRCAIPSCASIGSFVRKKPRVCFGPMFGDGLGLRSRR